MTDEKPISAQITDRLLGNAPANPIRIEQTPKTEAERIAEAEASTTRAREAVAKLESAAPVPVSPDQIPGDEWVGTASAGGDEPPAGKPHRRRAKLADLEAREAEVARLTAEVNRLSGLVAEKRDEIAATVAEHDLPAAEKESMAQSFRESLARARLVADSFTSATQVIASGPWSVHQAILEVMREVQAVGKSDVNEDVGFAFRGVDAMVNACGPAMRKHGLLMLPKSNRLASRDIAYPSHTAREVTGDVTWDLIGPDGSRETVTVPGESLDDSDKGYSKAMSVAWRIALIQTFVVPTGVPDPDSRTVKRPEPPRTRPPSGQATAGEENQAANGSQAAAGEESQVDPTLEERQAAGRNLIEYARRVYGWAPPKVAEKFAQWTTGVEKAAAAAPAEDLRSFLAHLQASAPSGQDAPAEPTTNITSGEEAATPQPDPADDLSAEEEAAIRAEQDRIKREQADAHEAEAIAQAKANVARTFGAGE